MLLRDGMIHPQRAAKLKEKKAETRPIGLRSKQVALEVSGPDADKVVCDTLASAEPTPERIWLDRDNRAVVEVTPGNTLAVHWDMAAGIFEGTPQAGFERWMGRDPECDQPTLAEIGAALTRGLWKPITCLGVSFDTKGRPTFMMERAAIIPAGWQP